MLQIAYLFAKIGADTAENDRFFAENLPKIGNDPTGPASPGDGPPEGPPAAQPAARPAPPSPGPRGIRAWLKIYESRTRGVLFEATDLPTLFSCQMFQNISEDFEV